MACCLARPCGGQVALKLVLPDALLYECVNAHTLRVGAPPPKWAQTQATHHPQAVKKKAPPLCGNCVRSAAGRCVHHGGPTAPKVAKNKCRYCRNSTTGPCKRHGGMPPLDRMRLYGARYRKSHR